MTDADVDGAHISTLLLTFLYRFMPALIEGGYYLAQPPLYKIEKNKKVWYAYDDKQLEQILTEIGRDQNNKIQRYKGCERCANSFGKLQWILNAVFC